MKLTLLLAFFTTSLIAETWVINRDHSVLNFEVPYLKISSVHGKFNNFSGSLILENEQIRSLNILIRSGTIDTGIQLRDSHLRSSDFLSSKKYPEIQFVSDEIKNIEGKYLATGLLLIKGEKLPLAIEFQLSHSIEDTWGKVSRFSNFTGKLSKSKLGINWNKTLPNGSFLLGDEISLKGSFQLQIKGQKTASSKHKMADNKYLRNREKYQRGEVKTVLEVVSDNVPINLNTRKKNISSDQERKSYSDQPDWLSYASFLVCFVFGLFGGCTICFILYQKFSKQKWHDKEFIDDSLKHCVYLLIVGFYVYFASLLFPYS